MDDVRLLCVDPDEAAREESMGALRANLPGMDPDVDGCGSIAAAEEALADRDVDCVVAEYDLPDGTGLDLAERVRAVSPDTAVVLFTDRDPDALDTSGHELTVADYLRKGGPDALTRLAGRVRMAVATRSQISYPLPDAEDERLDAVEAYDLGSPAVEASLERLTDLATRHFGVDSASVNVIEARTQRLLACRGLDLDAETMPREASICTFTILEDDGVMVVEDVREDPRFAPDADALEAVGIRSYMGAILAAPSGFPVGTLCIYDDEPRTFSAADREYLKALAAVGVDLIDAQSGGEVPDGDVAPGESGPEAATE